MTCRATAIALVLVSGLLPSSVVVSLQAQERLTGAVTRVADGDTLDITASGRVYTVRLEGIDAPEAGQPYSRQARLQLRVLAMSRTVTALVTDHDRYGRTIARVSVWGTDLSEEMVRSGLAWHYARYAPNPRLAALEREARTQRRGLWADPKPVAPWEYRLEHPRPPFAGAMPVAPKTRAVPGAPNTPAARAPRPGPYHGNTSSRVYHAPGCRDYDCRHCTEAFMSRASAEAAGYRPHEACVRR